MERRIHALGVALGLLLLGGCAKTERILRPEGPAPTAQSLALAQQHRLAAVSTLSLRGHAEISWRDNDSAHFDDGDFDLVARPSNALSLRVSKLGERILWIGGGDGEWWTVFPRERPSRAILRPWGSSSDSSGRASGPTDSLAAIAAPMRLFEALGLAPIAESEVTAISWDETRGSWRFDLKGRRIFARGESLLCVASEWVDEEGEVRATCELSEFLWPSGEREPGSRQLEVQPLVATRVTFAAWEGGRRKRDGAPDAELKLAAEAPTFGVDRVRPQLFRWSDVEKALRPEIVEDQTK